MLRFLFASGFLFLFSASWVWAETSTLEQESFLRVTKNSEGLEQALETAVVSYQSKSGTRVDMFAAVHIGEQSYYQRLNQDFKKYDSVLFELIGQPERIKELKDRDNKSMVSSLQTSMKDLLGLEFQLEQIDYRARNMLHADLTPDQFWESMYSRGETIFSMIMKLVMGSSAADNLQSEDGRDATFLLSLMLSPPDERTFVMRRYLASGLGKIDSLTEMLEGPVGSTVIADRNSKAMQVLKKEIAKGRKRIAIFYGAGHLPDMEKRLLGEFGFQKVSTSWLSAWRLRS